MQDSIIKQYNDFFKKKLQSYISWSPWKDITTFKVLCAGANEHYLLQGKINFITNRKKFKITRLRQDFAPSVLNYGVFTPEDISLTNKLIESNLFIKENNEIQS